jgi:hypothetical protein
MPLACEPRREVVAEDAAAEGRVFDVTDVGPQHLGSVAAPLFGGEGGLPHLAPRAPAMPALGHSLFEIVSPVGIRASVFNHCLGVCLFPPVRRRQVKPGQKVGIRIQFEQVPEEGIELRPVVFPGTDPSRLHSQNWAQQIDAHLPKDRRRRDHLSAQRQEGVNFLSVQVEPRSPLFDPHLRPGRRLSLQFLDRPQRAPLLKIRV